MSSSGCRGWALCRVMASGKRVCGRRRSGAGGSATRTRSASGPPPSTAEATKSPATWSSHKQIGLSESDDRCPELSHAASGQHVAGGPCEPRLVAKRKPCLRKTTSLPGEGTRRGSRKRTRIPIHTGSCQLSTRTGTQAQLARQPPTRGFPTAPERTRTSTDHSVHKALNANHLA